MTDCCVVVPMLGRSEHVARLAASLAASQQSARLLFVVTITDLEVIDAVRGQGLDHIVVPPRIRGDYADKINAGAWATGEPLIFTGACDLHFHPGWLTAAAARMAGDVKVVGTNDLLDPRTATGEHSTHTLVARDYLRRGLIDGRPGLMCTDYTHEFCDDELVGTARRRGVYAHAPDALVEHLHPIAGLTEWDRSYLEARRRMESDRPLFERRRLLWT